MAPTAHSTFSASASARLLACPGSYALALKVDEENGHVRRASVFSAEGTLAHAMAEACLHASLDPSHFLGETRTADGFDFTVDEDMVDALRTYVDHVRGLTVMGYSVQLETRVRPSGLWEALPPLDVDLFGTSDVVAYNPQTRDLRIVDLKFGRGVPVEAADNPQLLYYAAGALAYLREQGAWPETVTATIIQPRAPHPSGPVRWCNYTANSVYEWARTTLYEGVARALSDNGQTLFAGKHCRFCPVAPHCETLKNLSFQTARDAFLAAPGQNLPASAPDHAVMPQVTLSDAALGEILDKIEVIGPWIDAVKRLAIERLEAGQTVPGWKLVPKRPIRKWADEDTDRIMADMEAAGVDVDEISVLTLLTPAQAEKKVGKKRYEAEIAPFVVKTSSGVNLAPEADPRSVVARQTAQEAFGLLPGASNPKPQP